jgi:hypothetical protein
MAKQLILSPELLILAPLPEQRRGVGQALRRLVMEHGAMPMIVSPETMQGEMRVESPAAFPHSPRPHVHEVVRFQIEDWDDANSIVPGRRKLG